MKQTMIKRIIEANGIKTIEGSVERGTRVGVWKYWNEKGELSKKETFENGELVNIETFE